MADIQKHIEAFDDAIRLKRFDENEDLRKKRDILLDQLRAKFAAMREGGTKVPTFSDFNQGSYQMGTGIKPVEGDYDIDVGLRFNVKKSEYPNPVDLKLLVADALEGHTELGTEVRRSCVTVKYKKDGEQVFHVDFAVYAYEDPGAANKKLFLAKGKRDADAKNRSWEESDAEGLIDRVRNKFADKTEQLQFLRVIRLLKRWKTEKFKMDGSNAPSGIGLTVAALNLFVPSTRDDMANTARVDDLKALESFVQRMIDAFVRDSTNSDGKQLYRMTAMLPVAPYNDVLARMTPGQMTTFKERLESLRTRLSSVRYEVDPVDACTEMRREFGDEFPVPERRETGEPKRRAIATSGVSA